MSPRFQVYSDFNLITFYNRVADRSLQRRKHTRYQLRNSMNENNNRTLSATNGITLYNRRVIVVYIVSLHGHSHSQPLINVSQGKTGFLNPEKKTFNL